VSKVVAMRKLMLLFLLASAATPALARPDDADNDRPRTRSSSSESRPARAERSADHPARAERTPSADRPRFDGGDRPARAERTPSADRPHIVRDGGDRGSWGGDRTSRRPDAADDGRRTLRTREPRSADSDDRRDRNVLDRCFGSRDQRIADGRPRDGVWNEHVRDRLVTSSVPRPGTQPPLRTDRGGHRWNSDWNRHWRDNSRYDWRGHRDRHRAIFHIGIYSDPFGWGYQRYQPGWRMWPSYYGRSYWLNDPSMYRLPPAYPGTQWIRYHDDAILVDIWTGEVVDAIYDFFW
jgi:Ni/Co efflux regulator RcnB